MSPADNAAVSCCVADDTLGTPPGVGFARKPPVYLKAGDVCEVEIDGLGVLRNPVAAFEA